MIKIDKVLCTGSTRTTGGRDGASRSAAAAHIHRLPDGSTPWHVERADAF